MATKTQKVHWQLLQFQPKQRVAQNFKIISSCLFSPLMPSSYFRDDDVFDNMVMIVWSTNMPVIMMPSMNHRRHYNHRHICWPHHSCQKHHHHHSHSYIFAELPMRQTFERLGTEVCLFGSRENLCSLPKLRGETKTIKSPLDQNCPLSIYGHMEQFEQRDWWEQIYWLDQSHEMRMIIKHMLMILWSCGCAKSILVHHTLVSTRPTGPTRPLPSPI